MRITQTLLALTIAFAPSVLLSAAELNADEVTAIAARAATADAGSLSKLRELADGGNRYAQTALADLYAAGKGVDKDAQAALQWWSRAAEQGFAVAQYRVAQVHLQAMRHQDDLQTVRRWLEPAAEQGLMAAQLDFAVTYTTKGADWADDVQAFKWFTIGAAVALNRGPDGANDRYVIFAYNNLAPLRDRMSEQQQGRGQTLSREWLDQHGIGRDQEKKDLDGFLRRQKQ